MMKKDTLRNKRIGDAELAQVAGGSGSKPKTRYTVYCKGLVQGCGFKMEGFTSSIQADIYIKNKRDIARIAEMLYWV